MYALRPAVPLFAATILGLSASLAWPARSVFACSPTQPYQPVDDAALIVAGRVADWTIDTSAEGVRPVSYTLAVDDVLKGDAAIEGSSVSVADTGISYDTRSSADGWVSSNSLCGTFAADPTDAYMVVALGEAVSPGQDYESSWLTLFYVGTGPGDPALTTAVEEIESRLAAPPPPPAPVTPSPAAPAPPDVGNGNRGPSSPRSLFAVFAGAAAVAISGVRLARGRRFEP